MPSFLVLCSSRLFSEPACPPTPAGRVHSFCSEPFFTPQIIPSSRFYLFFISSFRLALLNRRTSEHCYIYTYMSYILYFTPCHFTFTTLYTYAPSSQFPPALALSPQFVSPPRLASLPFLLVLISSARASPCPSYMSKYCFFVTAVALEICAFAFPPGP